MDVQQAVSVAHKRQAKMAHFGMQERIGRMPRMKPCASAGKAKRPYSSTERRNLPYEWNRVLLGCISDRVWSSQNSQQERMAEQIRGYTSHGQRLQRTQVPCAL